MRLLTLTFALLASTLTAAPAAVGSADNPLPVVPAGFKVELFAREPLVRNPCAMAFDARGRLFVGQGPQYRRPLPDTPGDTIRILVDADGDGIAESATTFASGSNNARRNLADHNHRWRWGDAKLAGFGGRKESEATAWPERDRYHFQFHDSRSGCIPFRHQ